MTYTEKLIKDLEENEGITLGDDILPYVEKTIAQAIAEERERVVEAMMMKGIEAKMTPFQTTVNQYLRNRAEEIGIVLSSLDKDEIYYLKKAGCTEATEEEISRATEVKGLIINPK